MPINGNGKSAKRPSLRSCNHFSSSALYKRFAKGVATGLMEAAIAFAKTTQAKVFVLFGDRPIYAGHGFRSARNIITYTSFDHARTGDVITRDTRSLMVLPLKEATWDDAAPIDLLGWKF